MSTFTQKIVSRYDADKVLFECDVDSALSQPEMLGAAVVEAVRSDANLRGANLGDANLRGAYLGGANLGGANLGDANLRGAMGNARELMSIFTDTWPITYTAEVMQIGCERHSLGDWWEFDDGEIADMDSESLEFWRRNKEWLKSTIEKFPATPTNHKAEKELAA